MCSWSVEVQDCQEQGFKDGFAVLTGAEKGFATENSRWRAAEGGTGNQGFHGGMNWRGGGGGGGGGGGTIDGARLRERLSARHYFRGRRQGFAIFGVDVKGKKSKSLEIPMFLCLDVVKNWCCQVRVHWRQGYYWLHAKEGGN